MTPFVTFWVYFDEQWTGVRLAPGESRDFVSGGKTDEGWSSEAEVYTYDAENGMITLDAYSDGRDCDGRLSTEWHGYCLITGLDARPADEYGPARPVWQELRKGQRDYAAEAMGY
jgi:hypothetical protein